MEAPVTECKRLLILVNDNADNSVNVISQSRKFAYNLGFHATQLPVRKQVKTLEAILVLQDLG